MGMGNLEISDFFRSYVTALRPKIVTLEQGTALYRGSRFSFENYRDELKENRFFSKCRDTSEAYARTSFGAGDPYVINMVLPEDVALYDIPYPAAFIRAAYGSAVRDMENQLRDYELPERYFSQYRRYFPHDPSKRFNMLSGYAPQDWQRLHFVDALKSVMQTAAEQHVDVRGYISVGAEEVLLNADVCASAEMQNQCIQG